MRVAENMDMEQPVAAGLTATSHLYSPGARFDPHVTMRVLTVHVRTGLPRRSWLVAIHSLPGGPARSSSRNPYPGWFMPPATRTPRMVWPAGSSGTPSLA